MIINLFDPFIITLLTAGILIAFATAPLGCFLLWKRLSFFGDMLGHSALLGVALGILFHLPFYGSVLAVCLTLSILLTCKLPKTKLPPDTLLALVSYSCLAFSLILLAVLRPLPYDPASFLFGDLLLIDSTDMIWLLGQCTLVALLLYYNWRPLLLSTFDDDLSQAEGTSTAKTHMTLMILVGATVALSLKLIGSLLLPALLVIPATIAFQFSRSPEGMVLKSIIIALIMNTGGILISLRWNVPTGPTIVALGSVGCLVSFLKKR
jgi:zinc transport system permease protein